VLVEDGRPKTEHLEHDAQVVAGVVRLAGKLDLGLGERILRRLHLEFVVAQLIADDALHPVRLREEVRVEMHASRVEQREKLAPHRRLDVVRHPHSDAVPTGSLVTLHVDDGLELAAHSRHVTCLRVGRTRYL